MTTVGATLATSPGGETESFPSAHNPKTIVFEGEPQVVAQLMGAVVGSDVVPAAEFRALSIQGASKRRVVVTPPSDQPVEQSSAVSEFLAGVEQIEGEKSLAGGYPAIPPEDAGVTGAGYRTTGERFKLEGETFFYDSGAGFKVVEKKAVSPAYRVAGFLEGVSTGWGPWKSEKQAFSSKKGQDLATLGWLEEAPVTPSWSARMYFPINPKTTGHAFHRDDGTSLYKSGEVLYDAVTGTFQMKLHRKQPVTGQKMSPGKLESELNTTGPGCELAGDAKFMVDLGFLSEVEPEAGVVHLSSPVRLPLDSQSSLNALVLSTFSRHQRTLKGGEYRAPQGSSSEASLVGRLNVSDKLGQVHELRLRAGRATEFDWVVGQLCPVMEEEDVQLSQAYENALDRKTEPTIIAGE